MRKICPKCKGEGWYRYRGAEHLWLAPFTLGLTLIGTETECLVCDSKGYLED